MTGEHIQTGKKGEDIAVSYLKRCGYRIIEQNYRDRYGEIDIIAEDGDAIAFVEIKTKRSRMLMFGPPQTAVTPAKQKRIIRTAIRYIRYKGIPNMKFRFDVIGIILMEGGKVRQQDITLIKNAFQTRGDFNQ